MVEYIEREAARQAHIKASLTTRLIDAIPAADVAPVRHGRWSPVAFGIGICTTKYQCSVCKQYKDVDRPYKYCPHCGALMRETEHD